MPRNETVLNVFVASPSDVSEERKALESIVHELNKTWSNNLNLRLELIKWETDSYPGFGDYSQDVINKQVNDEYDVFVAIFWSKVGSPTKVSESGTLEELERAYNKYQDSDHSIDLMVYFKDEAIPPSKIDSEQLQKIQKLKVKLGEQGALYWTFDNVENFESLLRVHLSKIAQKWSSKTKDDLVQRDVKVVETQVEKNDIATDEDDYGILDYVEIYEDRMFNMTTALSSMAEATTTIGGQFAKRTDEISSLIDDSGHVDPKQTRKVIKSTSYDMDRYSEIMELQIKITSRSREEAFDALSKALAISVDFKETDQEDHLVDLEESVESMRDAAEGTIDSLSNFKEIVSKLPRLAINLNKSKRRVVKVLNAVLEETKTTVHSVNNVLSIISDMKSDKKI